ncbi:MAG: hypothetical protein IKG97_06635, partial [Lachnospiraceae bacterium]|nr:hypothetical protein [Lachnospiraceae bacterium]
MKVQHLEVDWPTKLDFDCQWYRIPDEANEKTHEPVTAAQKDFMVFCLDENDAEASFLGEPKKAP